MSAFIIKINAFVKGLILFLKPHRIIGFLEKPLYFTANLIKLSKWISINRAGVPFDDFFTAKRDYSKRYELYDFVSKKFALNKDDIIYLEFGVFEGHSFKWWLGENSHPESRFYGFDTFEGLPEHWGMFFGKGTLMANVPEINDTRATFIKGLFQETLPGFLREGELLTKRRKVILFDADLFSSTLFSLSSLHPFLNQGDLIFFDEFNVPNHEFHALKIMEESYYLKTKLIGSVNNYYQIALEVI
jgi:O-methyltransferase